MKKFFYSMAVAAMVAGAPMTMVSCDEDDVNTIVNIISEILSTNDLSGSIWDNKDDKDRLILSFETATTGNLYDYTKMEGSDMLAQAFSYTLDTSSSIITINLTNGGTRRYTVKSFSKGNSLVISYGSKTYTMVPYSE